MTDLADRLLFISLNFYLTIGVFFCIFFYALHAYMRPVEPRSHHKMHHTGVKQKSYLVLCVERISPCFFSWTASALYPWVISPAQRFTFLLQFFFLKIYLFIICSYTLAVFRHSRRGSQISLWMVVSHHVVAGIWTLDLWKSSPVLLPTEPSHQPFCYNFMIEPEYNPEFYFLLKNEGRVRNDSYLCHP